MELAISLPILCLLVLGVADIGRAYYYREAVANAGRQALRFATAAGQQGTGNTVCGSTAGVATSVVPAPGGSAIATIVNDAALESSSDGTTTGSAIVGATVTVTWHCAGGLAVTNATNHGVTDPADSRSDAVNVRVSYPMSLAAPVLLPVVPSGVVTIAVNLVGRAEY